MTIGRTLQLNGRFVGGEIVFMLISFQSHLSATAPVKPLANGHADDGANADQARVASYGKGQGECRSHDNTDPHVIGFPVCLVFVILRHDLLLLLLSGGEGGRCVARTSPIG
jgi:hypothetical protein